MFVVEVYPMEIFYSEKSSMERRRHKHTCCKSYLKARQRATRSSSTVAHVSILTTRAFDEPCWALAPAPPPPAVALPGLPAAGAAMAGFGLSSTAPYRHDLQSIINDNNTEYNQYYILYSFHNFLGHSWHETRVTVPLQVSCIYLLCIKNFWIFTVCLYALSVANQQHRRTKEISVTAKQGESSTSLIFSWSIQGIE